LLCILGIKKKEKYNKILFDFRIARPDL